MPQIDKISYTHEAFANWLIENPHRQLRDAAEYFGYTQSWLSTILHSDAFQEILKKKQALATAFIIGDLHGKLRGVADVALEKLSEKIEKSQDPDFLLDATDKLLHRMGYAPSSARNPGAISVQNTTVNNTISVSSTDLAAARAALLQQATPATRGEFQEPAQIALAQTIEGELLPMENKPS